MINGLVNDVHVVPGAGSSVVTGNGSNVGGLVGQSFATIKHSSTSGSVDDDFQPGSAANYVGGLVGLARGGPVYTSSSTANVAAIDGACCIDDAGALIGMVVNGQVEDSYAQGNVSIRNRASDLVGHTSNATLIRVYGSGSVSGSGGGYAGLISTDDGGSIVTDGYRYTVPAGAGGSWGTAINDVTSMKTSSNFVGFDFTNVWQANDGVAFPTLR
jgi:hypothetical protein